jgi:hypothetical protein
MTSPLTSDLELAHRRAVGAAVAGLSDPALGASRLTGTAVSLLAEAAVSSASPFLRAPLLSRLSSVLRLHPLSGGEGGRCPACGTTAPCVTAQAVRA